MLSEENIKMAISSWETVVNKTYYVLRYSRGWMSDFFAPFVILNILYLVWTK